MTDIETRLIDHLRERASAVAVRDGFDDVLAGTFTPSQRAGAPPRRTAVRFAAASVGALGIGAIALFVARDVSPTEPIDRPIVETAPTEPPNAMLPPSVTIFPVLEGVGESYGSYAVPAHAPTTRLIVGTRDARGWRDTFTVTALNDPEGDAPAGGRIIDVDGVAVTRANYFGSVLWFWTVGDVGIQVQTDVDSDPPAVGDILVTRVSDTEPPLVEVEPLPLGHVVLAGPTSFTDLPFPTAATTDGGREIRVEVRQDDLANSLLPGDYDSVDINGVEGLVSARLAGTGTMVAWRAGDQTVVLSAAASTTAEAIEMARRVRLVDRTTWDAIYGDPRLAPPELVEPASSLPDGTSVG